MNHKQELETNGFVVVENLVNQQTVSKLREEVRTLENATDAHHRRVIHLEFSDHALPHGLEWYGS